MMLNNTAITHTILIIDVFFIDPPYLCTTDNIDIMSIDTCNLDFCSFFTYKPMICIII